MIELPASGGCQCGQVSYQLRGEPLMIYACHCHSCQKRTGSAFSMGLMVLGEHLTLKGDLASYRRTSDAGEANTRYSCSGCGNVIYGVGSATAELLKLQPGTLDNTREMEPEAHIWVSSMQRWLILQPDSPQFETQPDDLLEVLAAAQAYRQQRHD